MSYQIGSGSNIGMLDQSIELLNSFFGPGWHELVSSGQGAQVQESASLIFSLLGALGIVAMSACSIMLFSQLMRGIIGTAHEGKVLGSQYHSVWTPLRAAFAVSLMAPIAKGGISAIQVFMLVMIGHSINFANNLNAVALDYLVKSDGLVISEVQIPDQISVNAEELAKGILKSLTIQTYQKYLEKKTFAAIITTTPFIPSKSGSNSGFYRINFNSDDSSRLKSGTIGSIEIPVLLKDSKIGKARVDGVLAMIDDLIPAAVSIVSLSVKFKEITPDPGRLRLAVNSYEAKIKPVLSEIMIGNNPDFKKNLSNFASSAKDQGFLALGSYYWTVSRYAERNNNQISNLPKYIDADLRHIESQTFDDLDVYLAAAESYAKSGLIDEAVSAGRNGRTSGKAQQVISDVMYNLVGGYTIKSVSEKITSGDPISNFADIGHGMLTAAVAAPLLLWAAKATAASIKNSTTSLPGLLANAAAGGTVGAVATWAYDFLGSAQSILHPFFLAWGAYACMLAFYLPSIPFILWTLAIVGWLLLVFESMVAAPLWAIAHAMPEGEGFAGEHAKQGYMLFLNVLIRPPLMVIGFFMAVVLITQIGHFVGRSFQVFYGTGVGAEHSSLIGIFAMLLILGILMMLICHMIFSLITFLPENVGKWIGQQVASLGEQGHTQKGGSTFIAASGSGVNAGSGAVKEHGRNKNDNKKGPLGSAQDYQISEIKMERK